MKFSQKKEILSSYRTGPDLLKNVSSSHGLGIIIDSNSDFGYQPAPHICKVMYQLISNNALIFEHKKSVILNFP